MFTAFSLPFSRLFGNANRTAPAINISVDETHDIETNTKKEARTLKHFIKANHTNHSIIYNNLRFHNHIPHILGSAYILGANNDQLTCIYEKESEHLEPWQDAPGEISKDDWRDFLGKKNYQRAWIDFFEDQLVAFGYDWKALLEHFLYDGDHPLVNCLVGGLAHPLIHLGYGYELNSRTVGIEALGLVACFYSDIHKYFDDPSYTRPASYTSSSILDILKRVAHDDRLNGVDLQSAAAEENISSLLAYREDVVLDHWNALEITDPREQFEESQKAAVALLVGTSTKRNGWHEGFDFYICHVLTSSHAIRLLLPIVPAKWQIPLIRQWWFFALTAYISQMRPEVELDRITRYEVDGKTWKHAVHAALTSNWAQDAHYIKAIRAMKNAAKTWGDDEQFYLRAALKFSSQFNDWGGFQH